MKLRSLKTLAASAAAFGILIVGLGGYSPSRAGILDFLQRKDAQTAQADSARPAAQSVDANPAPVLAPGQAPNYRAIVQQSGPAVVGVTVEGTRKIGLDASSGPDWGDDPFFQFFRGIPGVPFRIPHSGEQPFHGQGSGFIISRDGLILTNAHVVRDAQEVTVKLADRRELRAKVLGADAATDIAVLRVNTTGLPTVKIGDPKSLQVGDYVLAIGAPFGLDQSVATGHASHARLGVMVQDMNQALAESFGLQRPDGALVSNVDPDGPAAKAGLKPGDVITHVNGTPIERAGDLSSRIGMDAPGSRVTLKVWRDRSERDFDIKLAEADSGSLKQANSAGTDSHGQLGLALRPLTRQERLERSLDHGLIVEDVVGPAARAGIQPGDVVLGIDGHEANSVDQVRSVMRSHPKSVALLIERDGQKIFIPVKLG